MSEYNFDAKKVKDDLVQWIRNWFEINGEGCKAVVGISGGIDSSVVSTLCVEALGKDRVVGILMPNGIQKDINDALRIVNYLDIEYHTINIHDAVCAIEKEVKKALCYNWSLQSSINLPPRIRMSSLYAVSQTLNGRVANTSNLSESYVGFDTRYGDSVGDFAPLFNLTKTEIKQIAKELNLPDEIVNKVPADGLTGKSDEENFGFTYKVLDKYIRTGVIENLNIKKKIDERHEKNLFKLKPMPSFPYRE